MTIYLDGSLFHRSPLLQYQVGRFQRAKCRIDLYKQTQSPR